MENLQVKQNKKMKWDTKNCEDCRYWRAPERFIRSEFCFEHETESPAELDKDIRKLKKMKKENRLWFYLPLIMLSAFVIVIGCGMPAKYRAWQAGLKQYSFWLGLTIVIASMLVIPLFTWIFVKCEKEYDKVLKKLETKRSEWIKVPE